MYTRSNSYARSDGGHVISSLDEDVCTWTGFTQPHFYDWMLDVSVILSRPRNPHYPINLRHLVELIFDLIYLLAYGRFLWPTLFFMRVSIKLGVTYLTFVFFCILLLQTNGKTCFQYKRMEEREKWKITSIPLNNSISIRLLGVRCLIIVPKWS